MPLLGPLGSFAIEEDCRAVCEKQPNCTIYTSVSHFSVVVKHVFAFGGFIR